MTLAAPMHVLNQMCFFVDVSLCYDASVSSGFTTALPSEVQRQRFDVLTHLCRDAGDFFLELASI